MKSKTKVKETPLERKFSCVLDGANDFEKAKAIRIMNQAALDQGFELDKPVLEESFDADSGLMSYRMVATGTK